MADGPDNKPTQQLPAVPDWAVELTKSVKSGFAKTEADMETLKNEGQRTNLRLTRLEMRQDDVETRLEHNSIRAAAVSKTDMSHDAAISQVVTEVASIKESLADNTGLTADVKALLIDAAKTPIVRQWAGRVVAAAGVLALAVMGYATLAVNQRMAVMQTQVDRVPSVIVVPMFDAGGPDAHP